MSEQRATGEGRQLPTYLNIKLIRRGVILFISISLTTLAGIFIYTNTGKTLEVWKSFSWIYFFYCIGLLGLDLYIGALRNHIFIREYKPGISLWVSWNANLANIFMGAVTPSQSGGGPAQLYIYFRNGISLIDSFSNSFYNYISTMIFFPLSGAMALFILNNNVPEGFIMHLTKFGFSVFISLFILIVVGLLSPGLAGKIVSGVGRFLSWIGITGARKIEVFGATAESKMKDYRYRLVNLIRSKPQLMFYSFVLTVLLYFNKYFVAYIILMAFGLDVDFWTVIAIQAVVYLLLYFAPSPGGSGIAELSIGGLMAGLIAPEYLVSFTLLYRSFLVFIPALLGSMVVIKQLTTDGAIDPKDQSSISQPS